jgi:hypothetical protein
MAKGTRDPELDAINAILRALDGLDGESIQRVLDYVFGRLSIAKSSRTVSAVPSSAFFSGHGHATSPSDAADAVSSLSKRVSIRDLRDEKRPSSSNQMAALVAYYLSEVEGAQDSITSSDIQKYFKQGGFKLPKSISQTLPNAAAAGYFDSVGEGRWRLNPVGYNLVVHGLPRGQKDSTTTGPRSKKK